MTRVAALLQAAECDGLLLTEPENVAWLTSGLTPRGLRGRPPAGAWAGGGRPPGGPPAPPGRSTNRRGKGPGRPAPACCPAASSRCPSGGRPPAGRACTATTASPALRSTATPS